MNITAIRKCEDSLNQIVQLISLIENALWEATLTVDDCIFELQDNNNEWLIDELKDYRSDIYDIKECLRDTSDITQNTVIMIHDFINNHKK